MRKMDAVKVLRDWDKKGQFVFKKHMLAKFFPRDNAKALIEGLNRLLKEGILQRVCRGVYINKEAASFDSYIIERIAKVLRPGEYNYVSLESMLSEYGAISQILIDRLTVMTTGRTGNYKTPYGIIEFTHTKRPIIDIINNTVIVENRPLRVATKQSAWRDLKRVGRNTELVNDKELNNDGESIV